MYSAQTMVCAPILRYISRPKYTRQSPDCPLVIYSFTALPFCLHCSTSYSSAFAQHCIVAHPPLSTSCTRVHPHCVHYPRVSPSTPVSLLQVRPLPAISSESQHHGGDGAKVLQHYAIGAANSGWGLKIFKIFISCYSPSVHNHLIL